MSVIDRSRRLPSKPNRIAPPVVTSLLVLLLVLIAGCSRIESAIDDSLARGTSTSEESKAKSGEQPSSEVGNPASTEPSVQESSGLRPGTAEPADNPVASGIEGCAETTCSVSDAVTYEHLYQGSVTVVLYADFSELNDGECKVAVLSADGTTAQIFPLDYVGAWSMKGSDLTNIFYFLDPATDATKNVFFRMPVSDGWSASGLRPVSTGHFELLDLGYVSEDFSDIFTSQPMVGLEWGGLDKNGNYELKIEDAVARWDGQKYSAS